MKGRAETLYQLLEETIVDARSLDRKEFTPKYYCFATRHNIKGMFWGSKKHCHICLGGAFLASNLNLNHYGLLALRDLDSTSATMAICLDSLRKGKIGAAYSTFYRSDKYFPAIIPEHENFTNWKEFNKNLNWLEEKMLPILKEWNI